MLNGIKKFFSRFKEYLNDDDQYTLENVDGEIVVVEKPFSECTGFCDSTKAGLVHRYQQLFAQCDRGKIDALRLLDDMILELSCNGVVLRNVVKEIN